eukprot:1401027-Alexandrium_andersonii.AAC.1
MSASLVGSEMCIRDSPGPLREAWGVDADAPGPRGGVALIVGQSKAFERLCLLYTSDAADDM